METPRAAITLTDKAAEKIGELLGGRRTAPSRRCASPFAAAAARASSTRSPSTQAKDDDHVFEVDGVAVVVDKVSMQFVFGSEVDYVEGLQGAGFQVNNPNVVAACGCGSSFQVQRGRRRARRRLAAASAPRRSKIHQQVNVVPAAVGAGAR